MPQTLVLEDVVASANDQALQNIWTAIPGIIQSYDPRLQRATIQISVKSTFIAEDGDNDVTEIAALSGVPVVHTGGGGFRIVVPPVRGDSVLLVFCARSIDQWLAKGGVVDPFFLHHHDLSDAIAILGLRDFAHPLKNSPSDHASIGYDTGATIEFRQGEIRAGGDDADQAVVVQSALDDFMTGLGTAAAAVSTDPSAAAALGALSNALNALHAGTGWKANTTILKAK